jgi:hypothetical protein
MPSRTVRPLKRSVKRLRRSRERETVLNAVSLAPGSPRTSVEHPLSR